MKPERKRAATIVDAGAETPRKRPRFIAGPWDKSEMEAYICVSEPWPLGVIIPSQVPLATYFQA
jgi:hypothetical protein